METTSVSIENLCVPCHCGCRHCLLASQHCATGVDYRRGAAFAERFYSWLRDNRPELGGLFYVGYCNEFPELPAHISFVQKYAPWYDFLQFNGLKLRSREEIRALLSAIMERNIRLIDLTFYGLREYHDRFAGRKGDFDYLLTILEEANKIGLPVVVSVALTMENTSQMEALFEKLSRYEIRTITVFQPHAKGRGETLSDVRLTQEALDGLPQTVKDHFMRVPHHTEAEWLRMKDRPKAEKRALTLALTPENIGKLETMAPEELIRELEAMDDAYYAAIPSMDELAALVGKPDNQQLFRIRDLYLEWQKRYLKAHPIDAVDMNDERHSFSARIYP